MNSGLSQNEPSLKIHYSKAIPRMNKIRKFQMAPIGRRREDIKTTINLKF